MSDGETNPDGNPTLAPKKPEPRSTRQERQRRLINAAAITASDDPDWVSYQHTILCQTGLPYRDPGAEITCWKRTNGRLHLAITAGVAMNPEQGELVQVGLPFGPKPRLILAHLNGEALRQRSPEIEVQASLTAFVKRLKLDPSGRTIGTIKDQLTRLSAAHVTLGMMIEGRAVTVNSQIVSAFDLWLWKGEGHRVLWPSVVCLSSEYYNSLERHAVPLHEHALMALSGNAMALDVYAWLAQRLHRVDPAKPMLVPWPALQEQFGWGYGRLTSFRIEFRNTLRLVRAQYQGAHIEMHKGGLTLRFSQPPVKARTAIVVRNS